MKQTKIVASISDRRCDTEFIRALFNAGMNVVRMNTAHATEEGIRKIVNNVREVSHHIGILIDTKGPEVRTTACAEPIQYKTGDVVKIFGRPEMETTHDMINVTYSDFAADVHEGCHILFDDGALDLLVIGINGPQIVAQVQNDGVLGSRKSVNVPGVHIDLPTLTEKDRKNIMLAIDLDIEFIAHSFVRSAADVRAVQAILDAYNSDIKIISKIENQEGVDNIDEIIEASYGIMIARGDLGIEVPIERIPGIHIDLPALTEKDRKNIMLAIDLDIEFIAHSFVRSAADVRAVQAILDAYNSDIKIISKIENQEGVDNIDEIIEASYGIMIARGDLGIEVPIERIPGIQRQIIRKCVRAKKPVIVATQMLHSMIQNPRPTRAEVTDIANAIYYRTDALMLSGETATGKYPVEAVQTMAQIAEQAERDKLRENDIEIPLPADCDIREFMSHSAIEATEKLGVKGIIADSDTGLTARLLAAFRGPNPVLAICYNDKVQRLLALSYGVIPVYQKEHIDRSQLFHAAVRMLRQKGYLKDGDKIAYLSGNMLYFQDIYQIFQKNHSFSWMKRK